MKTFFLLSVLMVTSAFAKDNDFLCKGKDRGGRTLEVKWVEWVDNRQSARVDLTINSFGVVGPRTMVDLYPYVGDEGFDYGVSGGNFMFHIILPPNMLGGNNIAGAYYYGGDYSHKNRVILKCKRAKF